MTRQPIDPPRESDRTAAALPLHLIGLSVVDVARNEVARVPITVAGGRIVSVGATAPSGAEILDLGGCWACPSLVDMHAHVTFEPRAHEEQVGFTFDEAPVLGAMRAVQNLAEAARAGICLVRDAGGREASLSEFRRHCGGLLTPELVTSGPPLCLPEGHGSAFGQHLPVGADIDELLRRHAEAGHEWLKVMNGPELWPEDELRRIMAAARRAGLRTAVHAFTPDGINSAVLAGADTVEHGMVTDPDVVMAARRQGTVFVPTAYCSWISLRPRFLRTEPESERGHLDYWHRYLESCRPTHLASGLSVLPGTDAGCAPCSFDDYLEELAVFERWGMEPMAVLNRATLASAECLGRADDFGSIEVGKWANLIITERDPTVSTSHLRHPLLVLLKGAGVVNALGERWL